MLGNRFDAIKYLQDKDGLMFGWVEGNPEGCRYYVGFVSIRSMQYLRLDAISTVTITIDTDPSNIGPMIDALATRMDLRVTELEIEQLMSSLDDVQEREYLKVGQRSSTANLHQ